MVRERGQGTVGHPGFLLCTEVPLGAGTDGPSRMPPVASGAFIQDRSSQTLYAGFPFIGFGFCLLFGFVVVAFFSPKLWNG